MEGKPRTKRGKELDKAAAGKDGQGILGSERHDEEKENKR